MQPLSKAGMLSCAIVNLSLLRIYEKLRAEAASGESIIN